MSNLPSFIMGFREGLEDFLLIAIVLQYVIKIGKGHFRNSIVQGGVAGVVLSIVLGLLLSRFAEYLGGVSSMTKLWESGTSFIALLLVAVFIVWMIRHGTNMAQHMKEKVGSSISAVALFWVAFIIIAREGTEIAIFSFAGKYPFDVVIMGVVSAFVIAVLVFYSLRPLHKYE